MMTPRSSPPSSVARSWKRWRSRRCPSPRGMRAPHGTAAGRPRRHAFGRAWPCRTVGWRLRTPSGKATPLSTASTPCGPRAQRRRCTARWATRRSRTASAAAVCGTTRGAQREGAAVPSPSRRGRDPQHRRAQRWTRPRSGHTSGRRRRASATPTPMGAARPVPRQAIVPWRTTKSTGIRAAPTLRRRMQRQRPPTTLAPCLTIASIATGPSLT
mmetsp:Transcript_71341/g.206523  ORF Transcript_71341/g.206523 Transcript_71341/m.206523 type:complete len:214 (+) Transcript_71341:66-707(+)